VCSDSDESSLFFSGVLEKGGGNDGIPAPSDLFLGVKGGDEGGEGFALVIFLRIT